MDEELKAVLNGLKEGQEKIYAELSSFRNETNNRLDNLEQKVDQSVNGTESLNQRVWNLEKHFSGGGKQKRS